MACLMRDDHRQAIVMLAFDPLHEALEAFDQSPHPKALLINDKLAALGGVCGPPWLCPVGVIWLGLTEYAVQFRHALVRELKQQLKIAHEVFPLLVAVLFPSDRKSIRLAEFLGFRVELAYQDTNGLLYAVSGKKQKSSVLEAA
jgi:hypothetical protein